MKRYWLFGSNDYEENGGLADLVARGDDVDELLKGMVMERVRHATPRRWQTVINRSARQMTFRTFGFGEYESYMASLTWNNGERGYWVDAQPEKRWLELRYSLMTVLDVVEERSGVVLLEGWGTRVDWQPLRLPLLPALITPPQ